MIIPFVGRQRTIVGRQRALMRWYRDHGRHNLPWRLTRDPYAILVSEVMLQQTQVDRVIPYWAAWMRRWPTMESLARAKRASVIRAWAGLGYNRRAVNLHHTVQELNTNSSPHHSFAYVTQLANKVLVRGGAGRWGGERAEIDEFARELMRLPGIGPYTASALLVFAWNLPAPCVDTNVRRVLAHAIYRRPSIMRMSIRRVMDLAERVIPRGKSREWHYALMDYGALVFRARDVRNRPKRKSVPFRGSNRFWRGRIVAMLRDTRRAMPEPVLRQALMQFGDPPPELGALLIPLVREGMIRQEGDRYGLA